LLLSIVSSAHGQQIGNNRFAVSVGDNQTVTITQGDVFERNFEVNFVVLYETQDPRLGMAGVRGVKYLAAKWKTSDPERADTIISSIDQDSVGDGFDPELLKGSTGSNTQDVFKSAPSFWVTATSHTMEKGGVTFHFEDHLLFQLSARLQLQAGNAYPTLTYHFTPKKSGYYSVGYVGAPGFDLKQCSDIWQPLIWQEMRFPDKSYLTLAFRCPVPSGFVTADGVSTGVVADPAEFPFEPLPMLRNSRFGVAIRDVNGLARPMLFAPALGGTESKMNAGEVYSFKMHLFAAQGDTTVAQERVARELYGFTNYRNNALGSLNRTVDNIHDYILSEYSLFDIENKGCNYSTDAPGAVKNVSSIDPLDLAIVMDNPQMFEQRAHPYVEYMLSRGKFLFTTNEKQRIQSPSYRLDGPAAPISELAALYTMFHGSTPLFLELARDEYTSSRVRNLSVLQKGETWWNAIAMYRAKKDPAYLETAIKGADEYLKQRIESPSSNFPDRFFWTQYVPRYIELLQLYEISGEKRFLEAAHIGARRFAQFVFMSPAIPDKSITVNKGGKAPGYWYLKSKGHKSVSLPEEQVPAWRMSAIGLTPESSGTSQGHRAIFMANHAPWMLKIGYLTQDEFLMDIARSAVLGRYRNFPGYHINTARTTAYEKADWPLRGHKDQNVTSFHYNHIIPMLSMLMDYLVTDAHVRSNGQIDFPYNYSEGYAYMQNKAYGAMTGTFYDRDDALLWMPKALLDVPGQINYITARGQRGGLYIALMSESDQHMVAEVTLNQDLLPGVAGKDLPVTIVSGNAKTTLTCKDGKMNVPVPSRGLSALVIENLDVEPKFQGRIADLDHSNRWKSDMTDLVGADGRAMILNLGSQYRFAFVFLEYSKKDFTKVELEYTTDTGKKRIENRSFPWEFTVPLDADATAFDFIVYGHTKDGKVVQIKPAEPLRQ
jgi:hypothetical protein